MVRAQAWRLRCEVRGDVIDFPYNPPPQHNETIDVFYISKTKKARQHNNILLVHFNSVLDYMFRPLGGHHQVCARKGVIIHKGVYTCGIP